MGKLIYATITSLDGYIGDGHYDWAPPGGEGSRDFITEIMRPFSTYLYGRRNFETMHVWDSEEFVAKLDPSAKSYAEVWRSARKLVYSKTLKTVATANTELFADFNVNEVRGMKSHLKGDACIGGPTLAAQALRAGLVDELALFVVPTTFGSSGPVIPILPRDQAFPLSLLESRPFSTGWIYLRYGVLPK